MVRRPLVALGAALLIFFWSPVAVAQQPSSMLATDHYLFVIKGDWLYQFDLHTLQLRNKAHLSPGQRGNNEAIIESISELSPTPPGPDEVEIETVDTEFAEEEPAVGGGAGGRFGGRGARGPAPVARAVDLGLRWLVSHQDEDGKWDADGFMKHDTLGPPSNGAGNSVHDVGVTGLAMLAILGNGSTLRSGPHRDHLRRATKWLRDQQQASGLIGTNVSHDFIYDHAIAACALCEVYGLSQYKALKSSAQKALDYLESHRNPYAVWRYQPRDNDNDTSVTSWCLIAYKSGEFFDLRVNQDAIRLGLTYLDQVTSSDGLCGYTKLGERSSRMPGKHATVFPVDKTETLTAAGLFCRFFLGQNPKETEVMLASANRLVAKPPLWDQRAGTIDHYYWYYGTHAMYQMGGEYWKKWSQKMLPAVVDHQVRKGNGRGSWSPVGVWGESGGRVYSTALMLLTLETYYRYARLTR